MRDYYLFKEGDDIMKKLLLIIFVVFGVLYVRNREINEMHEFYSVDFEEEESKMLSYNL